MSLIPIMDKQGRVALSDFDRRFFTNLEGFLEGQYYLYTFVVNYIVRKDADGFRRYVSDSSPIWFKVYLADPSTCTEYQYVDDIIKVSLESRTYSGRLKCTSVAAPDNLKLPLLNYLQCNGYGSAWK